MSSFPEPATSAALACSEFRTESFDHVRFDVPCPSLPLPESMGLAERVLGRIRDIEQKESDPWSRDDLRVAWLTVEYASQGHADPWRAAFIHYFDGRPEKMIPFWVARAAKHRADFGPTLAEQMAEPAFIDNLAKAHPGPVYFQPQSEFTFITEAKRNHRAVMQGKKAA